MNVLGIRCSNRDYTFAILTGTKQAPEVIRYDSIRYPKGFSRCRSLDWFLHEMDALIKSNNIKRVVIKRFEGQTRGRAYEERVEYEAMVYLATHNCGISAVFKKVMRTMAKDLGLKGKARYLYTKLDTSKIPNFENYSPKAKDAIYAGWSELP